MNPTIKDIDVYGRIIYDSKYTNDVQLPKRYRDLNLMTLITEASYFVISLIVICAILLMIIIGLCIKLESQQRYIDNMSEMIDNFNNNNENKLNTNNSIKIDNRNNATQSQTTNGDGYESDGISNYNRTIYKYTDNGTAVELAFSDLERDQSNAM